MGAVLKLKLSKRLVQISRYKYEGTIWDERDIKYLIWSYQSGLDWGTISATLYRKPTACKAKMYQLRSIKRNQHLVGKINLQFNRRKSK